MPTAAEWRELEELRKTHAAEWMIWEGDPAPESVDKLAAVGIRSVTFSPCGNRPAEGDYLAVMTRNLAALEAVFQER